MIDEEELICSREILFEKYMGVDFSGFDSPAPFSHIFSEAQRWLSDNWGLIYNELKKCYDSEIGILDIKLCHFLGKILSQMDKSKRFKLPTPDWNNNYKFIIKTDKWFYIVYEDIFVEFEFIFSKETENFSIYHFVQGLNMLWSTGMKEL